MAFRASNSITSDAYLLLKRAAAQLKINLQGFNSQLAASGADYDFLRDIWNTLRRADAQFDDLKTTPGLAQYARDQENDQDYDVAPEFVAMQGAIAAASAWMNDNVPTNVTAKAPADWGIGTLIEDTFTPAQTGGLRAALQGVIDEIV